MSAQPFRRKLIEVSIPLDDINREAAREKSIRHGHPSTLHLWWARRPLAACRAVLFAQLVDDPSSLPEQFPTPEAQDAERERLFAIMRELVKWESTTDESVLQAARNEILRSCDGAPPPIVDPFAGGGSIPLEAQRLGLEAHASDLNPVAVLINKALIEIPPRWAGRPPVHPDDGASLGNQVWTGAKGLADDVRFYGRWMRDEAERRIGHLYPKATLPDGTEATVIAWIWARTVTCPNPACGATMPLASSFWLGKKKGKEAWVRPVVEGKKVRFEIGHGPEGPSDSPKAGRGGNFVCLVCGELAREAHIKAEGLVGRLGTQLMAVVAEGRRQRTYLAPTEAASAAAFTSRPNDVPTAAMPSNPRWFSPPGYGMTDFADVFTHRQLTALCTFSDLVGEARTRIETDARATGLDAEAAAQYATDVATYLAFANSKLSDRHSTITNWYVSRESTSSTFARQALPMTWDFAETNPLESGTGTYWNAVDWTAEVLEQLDLHAAGVVRQADASRDVNFAGAVVSTDPPYYDNIGYADLADYFYVWLRRTLRDDYPDLLGTMLTPKAEELVATPYRFDGSKERAKEFFEQGFVETFTHARQQSRADFPMTIFYAFKQSEDEGDEQASTGWETMLEGLNRAGLMVTGTWPMRTELSNRMIGSGTNALASSIVLVCRPRADTAGITDRAGFLASLRAELPRELALLQQAAIAPVDLAQASIGPGMAVFSRYAKVIEPSGEAMRVRTALGLINQVLAEVLDAADGELDAPTRWAIKWFDQRGFDEGPFGEAEVLAVASGVAIDGLVKDGIVRSSAGKVRLLERDELPEDWDPVTDDRVSVWEATQHLVKTLDERGEAAAAELLDRLGGYGDAAQQLAYRLYSLCERKGWSKEAGPYNALAAVWGSLRSLAAEAADGAARATAEGEQGRLL